MEEGWMPDRPDGTDDEGGINSKKQAVIWCWFWPFNPVHRGPL